MSRSFWSVMRTGALLGPVAAAAIVATACGGDGSSQAAAAAPPTVIEIGAENVITVAPSSISVGPLISGELRAEREANERSRGESREERVQHGAQRGGSGNRNADVERGTSWLRLPRKLSPRIVPMPASTMVTASISTGTSRPCLRPERLARRPAT